MTYPLDFGLSFGAAGLTLAAQLVDSLGADVGSEIATGFVEIGNGNYLWAADIPSAHRGGVKFYEDGIPGTVLGFSAINPEEAENIDVKTSGLAAAAGTDAASKILTTPANKLATDTAGRVDLVDAPNATAVLALKANVAATAAVANVAAVAAIAPTAAVAAVAAVAGVANATDVVTAMEANGSKLDHLWEMTEDDAGTRQFTAHALLHTPAAQINITDQEIANAVGNLAPVGIHATGSLGANLDSILSTMALEATLTAMKGAGWTTETLAAIDVLLDAIKAKTDTITTALFTAVSGLVGDEVTIYHGATFDETVTGLTIPSDWVKLLFTLKANDADADVAALAQVQESNPGIAADGLIRINAAAPGAGENARADLIVSQAAGTVRIRLHQLATVALLPRSCRWDLKVITSDTIAEGTPLVVSSPAEVRYTTTRATG
jgi:hypothetical protein